MFFLSFSVGTSLCNRFVGKLLRVRPCLDFKLGLDWANKTWDDAVTVRSQTRFCKMLKAKIDVNNDLDKKVKIEPPSRRDFKNQGLEGIEKASKIRAKATSQACWQKVQKTTQKSAKMIPRPTQEGPKMTAKIDFNFKRQKKMRSKSHEKRRSAKVAETLAQGGAFFRACEWISVCPVQTAMLIEWLIN